jgi:hypothetical protein
LIVTARGQCQGTTTGIGGLVKNILAIAAATLLTMPAHAIVVLNPPAQKIVATRDVGTLVAPGATAPVPRPSPAAAPAIDPLKLAVPVLLIAILLLQGDRAREPRPVIA